MAHGIFDSVDHDSTAHAAQQIAWSDLPAALGGLTLTGQSSNVLTLFNHGDVSASASAVIARRT